MNTFFILLESKMLSIVEMKHDHGPYSELLHDRNNPNINLIIP